MADIVERLTWLSSRHAEHMNDGPRLTDFCHAGREAASVITALRAEVERLREASTDGYTVTFIPPPPAGETSDDR